MEHMELSLSQNSEQKSRKSLFQKVKHSALKQHFKSAPAREKQRHTICADRERVMCAPGLRQGVAALLWELVVLWDPGRSSSGAGVQ